MLPHVQYLLKKYNNYYNKKILINYIPLKLVNKENHFVLNLLLLLLDNIVHHIIYLIIVYHLLILLMIILINLPYQHNKLLEILVIKLPLILNLNIMIKIISKILVNFLKVSILLAILDTSQAMLLTPINSSKTITKYPKVA
jgi:hypothetical protein